MEVRFEGGVKSATFLKLFYLPGTTYFCRAWIFNMLAAVLSKRSMHSLFTHNNPNYTIEYIASRCGFKTARQLQRILKNNSLQ